jgi:uncharacterized protein YrrD
MAQLELHIGAHVKSRDGKGLGSIQRLIVHPDTNRVDGFLLGKGHLSKNWIVSAGQVESADPKNVVLKLDGHEAEKLPVYIHEQIVRAPGDLVYQDRWGMQYGTSGTGDQWVMRSPDSSTLSPTDSGSLFATTPIGNIEAQNLDDLPADSVLLSKGTEVVGSDGHKIGHVDEIYADATSGITGFRVKAGHLFTHDLDVPMSLVAGISHAHIRLNVSAAYAIREAREAKA